MSKPFFSLSKTSKIGFIYIFKVLSKPYNGLDLDLANISSLIILPSLCTSIATSKRLAKTIT